MKHEITKLITQRLTEEKEQCRQKFSESKSNVDVRYFFIDELLPDEIAHKIYENFPDESVMRLMKSFRETKFTSKEFDQFNSLMSDITFAIQEPEVIALIEEITGIVDQRADETLYAGGLSAMAKGHFLNPHIDNSHEMERKYYRTLNLLYYITPNWKKENGGNLELWDTAVKENITIHSKFNRLVVMETNPTSWHSVSEVIVDHSRRCVSNYYFSSKSPTEFDYFNVTSFSARPEQKLRRIIASFDNKLRNFIRAVVPSGLGKKDVYKAEEHKND